MYQTLQITQKSKLLCCTIKVYLMFSKLNERFITNELFFNKYLYLENFSPCLLQ